MSDQAKPETIDTGDTVLHGPTGERWVVACVQGDRLSWCGWPEGTANLADCVLVEKASPESKAETTSSDGGDEQP